MSQASSIPETINRAVVVLIVLYFALVVYAGATGNAVVDYAADFLFGVIAVGVGTVLFAQADGGTSAVLAAGVCFVAAGLAQFGALLTGMLVLELVTTFAVLVGISLYVYVIWIAD